MRMDLIERVVPKHIAHLARVDVVALERRQRRREEPPAERTLIVGELHERHGCVRSAECWRVRQARTRGAGQRGGTAGDGALLHEPQDRAKQALEVCEVGLDAVEIRLDRVEVPRRARRRLRPDRRDHQREHRHRGRHGRPHAYHRPGVQQQVDDPRRTLHGQCAIKYCASVIIIVAAVASTCLPLCACSSLMNA